MEWSLMSYFFGGIFLANGIPHFNSGISGRTFQTPFAKPPGKGYSSSYMNVIWGLLNWIFAYVLLIKIGAFSIENQTHFGMLIAGALTIGLLLAKVFGDIHGGTRPQNK